MNILGVIPVRYASTRFPGKPLAMIHGKSMIQRVYEQASKSASLHKVVVATDDNRIFDHVKNFGGTVLMTSTEHNSGTERCHEAFNMISREKDNINWNLVINIQGDEPLIDPSQIDKLASLFTNNDRVLIGTLAKKITDLFEITDQNIVKVIFDHNKKALYFSRLPIPFVKDLPETAWLTWSRHYKHIGLYAYRPLILHKLIALPPSPLETAESLEQLRWIENGYDIYVEITETESISVDIPDDLSKITNII